MSVMNYETRRSLEQAYETYLSALEAQDPATMADLWSGSGNDQLYSVLGAFYGDAICQDYMHEFLPRKVKAAHIGYVKMQPLMESEEQAMMQCEYEVILAMTEQENAVIRTLLETQMYVKTEAGWKLSYIQQSWKPEDRTSLQEISLQQTLDAMLGWIATNKEQELVLPRTLSSRIAMLREYMASLDHSMIEPDEKYLQLQKNMIDARKQQRTMRILNALENEPGVPLLMQEDPVNIAADGIIGFLSETQSYDPLLSLDAGVELQQDIAAIMNMKPREILELSGYQLPVKGVMEVMAKPVYGLFTRRKQEYMEKLFREVMEKAHEKGWRNLVIDIGWHEQLHVPLSFARRMVEILKSFPTGYFERVAFQVFHNHERKALQAAVDACLTDGDEPEK